MSKSIDTCSRVFHLEFAFLATWQTLVQVFSVSSWGNSLALQLQTLFSLGCPLFGGEQVVYSVFVELFRREELPSVGENGAMRVKQNSKFVGRTAKQ